MHHENQEIMPASEPVLPGPMFFYITGAKGELFHDIIEVCQRETKAPISLCIQAALGVGAFVQQGLVEIESPSGQITPASLLLFGVLEPAAGKSFVMDKFTAPINKFIEAQTKKRQKSEQCYSHEQERWEKTRKNLDRKLAKAEADATALVAETEVEKVQEDTESGTDAKAGAGNKKYEAAMKQVKIFEAALKRHSKEAPQPPPSVGLDILSEATPAAIPKFIKDNRVQSLAIVSAEAEEFFGKGIKNQSSLLNKGFSGEKTSKHLATRGDESHNIPITSLVFGQPYIMDKALQGDDNRLRATGTLSRCLFTCPPSIVGFQHTQYATPSNDINDNSYASVDGPATEKRYRHWLSKRLNRNVNRLNSDIGRQRLKLSRDALEIWYLGRAELDFQLRAGGRYAEFRDHGNRLPEQWLRVALVIHGYNQHDDEDVSAQTLRLAIWLVNSFSTEFQIAFRQTPQEEQDAMKLRKWINDKRAQGLRYIGKSFAATSSPVRSASRLNNAIQFLCQRNEISVLGVPCYNNQGRATKSMNIIDLYPTQPFDQYNFNSAIQSARMLNNR